MAYRSSSTANTSGTSINVPVPASAATDDIAILCLNLDNTGHGTITQPTGFTLLFTSTVATPDGHTQMVSWKRLTGADSGNYTPSWTGSNDVIGMCALFSGRSTSSDPTATAATNTSSNANPVAVGAATITAVDGDDLIWIGGLDGNAIAVGGSCAAPSGYTERQDVSDTTRNWCNLSIATQDNVGAGATGTVTGTYTIGGGSERAGWLAHLVRIPKPAAAGAATTSTYLMMGV